MSQNIERLKELLFESETSALAELSKRIAELSASEANARDQLSRRLEAISDNDRLILKALQNRLFELIEGTAEAREDYERRVREVSEIDAAARSDLLARIDNLNTRAGNEERLTESVADVIADALRRAEVKNHAELSHAIAPLVVSTIKTELRNSQDEMVEALYPITGRLVKSYVASAIKDLTEQMNRRIEQNPVMLRLQSVTTGRPIAELALAGAQDFEIKDLYLIRRGSGELLAHWPESLSNGREHMMSGVLAAINEFANEALSAENASLREIDIGGAQIYLRGSPNYLLAARCSGPAPELIAQALDDAFITAVERQHALDNSTEANADAKRNEALAEVGTELTGTITDKLEAAKRSGGIGALKAILTLIFVPLLGFLGWLLYDDIRTSQIRTTAERVIAANPDLIGYPMAVSVNRRGNEIVVVGLAPSREAHDKVLADLSKALPNLKLDDRINLVAGSNIKIPDVSPELSRIENKLEDAVSDLTLRTRRRSNERAETRLEETIADLGHTATAITDTKAKTRLTEMTRSLSAAKTRFAELAAAEPAHTDSASQQATISAYEGLSQNIADFSGQLLALAGLPDNHPADTASEPTTSLDDAIAQFSAATERLAALTSAVAAKLIAPPLPPRERLRNLARDRAIFFADDTAYRDPADAERTIKDLAAILKLGAGPVRLVGYTDETGPRDRNELLGENRASKVKDDLVRLGADARKILVVGRADGSRLSESRGPQSSNRRVQFEPAFENEIAR